MDKGRREPKEYGEKGRPRRKQIKVEKVRKKYLKDGSISEVIALQAWGPESDYQNLSKNPGHSGKYL